MSDFGFSAKTNSMYDISMKDDYIMAGTWPDDINNISQEVYNHFLQDPPKGKALGSLDGMPAWVDIPPLSKGEALECAINKKASLMSDATQSITVWQTKLLMGRKLSEDDKASLNSWIDYIDELQSLDLSSAPDVTWPILPS